MAELDLLLPRAVFGPLANGSDVRLLARPVGGELTARGMEEFSRFYYAGWNAASEGESTHLAFFPLDQGHWGLAKSQVLGRRSMGLAFVTWLALVSDAQLDRIGWATHRLWDSSFPEQLWLVDPGSRLDPVEAILGPQPTVDRALADRLAYAVDSQWEQGARVYVPPVPALGGTPLTVLANTWTRLGTLVNGRSYATWPQLEEQNFVTSRGPLDLIVGSAPRGRGSRVVVTPDAAPSMAWLDHRLRNGGIAPGETLTLGSADVSQIAQQRFAENRDRLVRKTDFRVFGEMARADFTSSVAAPFVLRLTVEALASRPDKASAAIDAFVADALPNVQDPGTLGDPYSYVAGQAITSGLIFHLKPDTIRDLSKVLFGSEAKDGLTRQVRDELRRQVGLGTIFSDRLVAGIETIATSLHPGNEREALREDLLAVIGAIESVPNTAVETYLLTAPSFVEVDLRYRRMAHSLPPVRAQCFERRAARSWYQRGSAALAGKVGIADALDVVLAILADAKAHPQRRGLLG